MTTHLEPASTVIRKLGGVEATARAAGVHPSRVIRWRQSRDKGGTDGRIPTRHQETLLAWAREQGLRLTYRDFFSRELHEVA